MSKQLNIRFGEKAADKLLYRWIKSQPNMSDYLKDLALKDMLWTREKERYELEDQQNMEDWDEAD